MRKILAAVFVLTALGSVVAKPARPLYEPIEQPKPPGTRSIAGTTWTGQLFGEFDDFRIVFKEGGKLEYIDVTSKAVPGTWKQTGIELFFDINNNCEFKTVIKGNLIDGVGRNRSGVLFAPRLTRVR